ncbi:hypothetical protein [Wenyingzhuangia marina]|uniref:Outer membrane lipoprotein-sorting protein n=1 Tax=Wenyingzhuangia marina TaxID=1195760 RepID=A0A1M5VMC0_9FLAO|nr:hypothetical protein [Wenyingzhuangia marina]GGF71227.1 hypothetical protein GCM10011397_12730 [Wenyingzhuangia marina]SHH76350.1 hypothetical protein SAMN05444281_1914 [Wenyingzhuangia marina]
MKLSTKIKSILLFSFLLIGSINIQAQNSSKKAKEIALEVMEQMGGVKNWNNTHFIKWDFGKRTLYWDKWSGDVRVENPEQNLVVLVNINTLKGKSFKNGVLVEDTEKAQKLLQQGKEWWINDSYWLVMPWKLLDPGVNLKYIETEKLPDGHTADVLQMTFENVGVTPENKYLIYVDQQEHLVKQWSYFPNFNDKTPKFTMAWNNYQKAGNILLSFDRLNGTFGPKNVVVSKQVDNKIFTEL